MVKTIIQKLSIKKLAILASLFVVIASIVLIPRLINHKSKVSNVTENNKSVLAASSGPYTFNINVPATFNGEATFANIVKFEKNITAPNVIYSIKEGDGIDISSGQNPTLTNTGVTSLQGSTGALTLTAGSGISVSGLGFTNSDTGSAQNIFKTIAVDGQTSIAAGSNSDTLTFENGTGITVTTDATGKIVTITADGAILNSSGWIDGGTQVYTKTLTDKVGIGTATPNYLLDIAGTASVSGDVTLDSSLNVTGNTTADGDFQVNGNTVLGDTTNDTVTFNGHLANGSSVNPSVDLGADLGSADLRFNNLFVANLNSESGLTTSGQATFTYSPANTNFSEATFLVNPASSVANGDLLDFGVAGYQHAGFDAEGDLTLGYSGAISSPTSTNPLSIYGHNTTQVASIDATGLLTTLGNLDINGTTNDIAGTLNLSGNNLTSSGALTVTPAAGSNFNVVTSGAGQFTVNNSQLAINALGEIGIGTAAQTGYLDIATALGTSGLALTNSGTQKLALAYNTNGASVAIASSTTNRLTNGDFETNTTGWTGNPVYSLDDEFSDTLPATLASGGVSNPSPTIGSNVIVNGTFDTDTGWTKGTGWTIESNVSRSAGAAGNNYLTASPAPLVTGTWYDAYYNVVNYSSGLVRINAGFGVDTNNGHNANGTYFMTGRALNTSFNIQSMSSIPYVGDIDNIIVHPLTLSSLFSSVTVAASTDHVVQVDPTVTTGAQGGVVLNLDSSSSPTKFVIGYIGYTSGVWQACLDKNVSGTYSAVIACTNISYVAGQTLKVIQNGTSYSLFYNGNQVGTTQTISASDVPVTNIHGVFSTYASNSFANFSIKGGINGTLATDGVNTRKVTDTLGYESISSGKLNYAGGVTGGNPGIWYPSIARSSGLTLITEVTDPVVSFKDIKMGFSSAQSNSPVNGFYLRGTNTGIQYTAGSSGGTIGSYSAATSYQFATVLKTAGSYYFVKGGLEYPNWTLLFMDNGGSSSPLYPGLINYATAYTHDFIKLPTAAFTPTPLAYDTFTRADGALGTSETTGPDAQTTPGLSWTGSTWTVYDTTPGNTSTGVAINTPTLGNELVTNGNMETGDPPSTWTYDGGLTKSSVADQRTGGTGTQAMALTGGASALGANQNFNAANGTWLMVSSYSRKVSGTSGYGAILQLLNNSSSVLSSTFTENSSWTNFVNTTRLDTTNGKVRLIGQNGEFRYDDVSVRTLTTSELFSSVSTSTVGVVADVNVTLPGSSNPGYQKVQGGLVLNLDSTSNPQNFIIAYYGGAKVYLDKAVGGTYTNLIAATTTYSAGATLRVTTDNSTAGHLKVRVYYNNALVGSEQDITDAGIISNTKHGLFSTYSGNQLDNFSLFPRGTGNEYAQLTPENLTVTRDTGTHYLSTASVKLVAGATDGDFTQSINVGNTSTYTLNAYAYTDGSAVTASDLSLYYDTAPITTTYAPAGTEGWYKLTGTVTGAASSKLYGVRVKAGKTVYVDNISTTSGSSFSNLYVMNSGTGLTAMDVQGATTLHSGLSGNQAMIVKGVTGQTANLEEFQDSNGNVLGIMTASGQLGLGVTSTQTALNVLGTTILNATSGNILTASASGTTKFSIDTSGNIISATGSVWKPVTDSSTALAISNSTGTSLVSFDTTNTNTTFNAVSGKNAITLASGGTNVLGVRTDTNSIILDTATSGTNKLLNGSFETADAATPSGILNWNNIQNYVLDDEFTATRSAGAVNNTSSDTLLPGNGVGTRKVTDVENKLSIGSGTLNFSGGKATPAWGDPGLWFGSNARTAGQMFVNEFTSSDVSKSLIMGYFNSQGHDGYTGLYPRSSGMDYTIGGGTGSNLVSTISNGTSYLLATVLRSSGAYYFMKGGNFSNWTLVFSRPDYTTTPLFPGYDNQTEPFTSSFARIPTTTFLPIPLAYDTFTRADGALGTSETTGPDSQTTPALSWTGSTWTVTSPEAMTNGGFETVSAGPDWGTWIEGAGNGNLVDETTLVHSGGHSMKAVAGVNYNTQNLESLTTLTAGVNYTYSFWTRGDGTNAGRYRVYDATHSQDVIAITSTGVTGTTYTQVSVTFTVPAGAANIQVSLWCPGVNGGIAYFDDVTVRATSGTVAVNTPTLGSEVISYGDLEAWNDANTLTDWGGTLSPGNTLNQDTDKHGGTYAARLDVVDAYSNAYITKNNISITNNTWYALTVWAKASTTGKTFDYGGTAGLIGNFPQRTLTTDYAQYYFAARSNAASLNYSVRTYYAPATSVYFDDLSFKPLTPAELFSSVSTSTANVIADTNVTLMAGTQAGLVLNLDSTTNPQNFVIAYHDGANVRLEKAVAGVYTSVQSTAVAYSAGAMLRVVKDGTKYRVYYNNALVGTEQTISDAGIINNTKHGLFSTYSGNQLDNFTLFARGTSGEYTGIPAEDLAASKDSTKFHTGSSSVKLVAAGNDANFLQQVNVGDTSTYTFTAYAYTNGSAVTTSDLDLYFDTAAITTSFAPAGGGWYKLTGTLTGAASLKNFGVRVHAGKTVYVDDMYVESSGGAGSTFFVTNSGSGTTGLDVQGMASFHSGTAASQALIIKAFAGQTANLTEWQNNSGTTLASITPTGLVNASAAGLATYVKAGTISDSDFTNPVNGLMGIDSTNGRIYLRYGGSWYYVAKTAGFQIPVEETAGMQKGDLLIPYVEKRLSDGALHGLYAKSTDIVDMLFASESAQLSAIEQKVGTDLSVTGTANLGNTTITGTLTNGKIIFTDNDISSSDIIKFISTGSIEFAGGTVEVDADGNLIIKTGVLGANSEMRGQAILPAGEHTVTINKAWKTAPATILTTPLFPTKTWTSGITKDRFTINSSFISPKDELINWVAIW